MVRDTPFANVRAHDSESSPRCRSMRSLTAPVSLRRLWRSRWLLELALNGVLRSGREPALHFADRSHRCVGRFLVWVAEFVGACRRILPTSLTFAPFLRSIALSLPWLPDKRDKGDVRFGYASTDLINDRPAAETWRDTLDVLDFDETASRRNEPRLSDDGRRTLIA